MIGAIRDRAGATARSVAALAGLTATLPIDLVVVAGALARRATPPAATVATDRRTVLITGAKMTKALALARAFHLAGHRVVLAEAAKYRLTGHRFSVAVDAFHVIPEPGDPGYETALLELVEREAVDVFLPVSSPASSVPEARVAELLAKHCEILHGDAALIAAVDDKDQFSRLAEELGLRVPHSARITDLGQIDDFPFRPGREYVLKRVAYNPVGRMDLTRLRADTPEHNRAFAATLPISPADPWILQEFVEGDEYCTHATVREGVVTVYGCCVSSAFQVNYGHVDVPEIWSWVRTFAERTKATGQLSFDFIVAADGHPYAIECNPRTHSAITMFYDHPELAAAYLTDGHSRITPLPGARPTHWTYHELWRLLRGPDRRRRIATIAGGTDAIFAPWDPLPYLAVHHLQIPSLLLAAIVSGRRWSRIDFNIGKLVEAGGD